MKNFRKIFFPFLLLFFIHQVHGQRDNSLKVVASYTGLGLAYEFNPAKIIYVEGALTTAFTVTSFNLQSKIAVLNKEKFKIKVGVEGAYISGNFKVGGIEIDYSKYPDFVFMPIVVLESKVLGLQLPFIIERDFSAAFPIVAVTLNVSKDKPANRVPRTKRKKDKKSK